MSEARFYCEHPDEPWGDFAWEAWRHAKGDCEVCDDERALFWRCRLIVPIGEYQPCTMPQRLVLPR